MEPPFLHLPPTPKKSASRGGGSAQRFAPCLSFPYAKQGKENLATKPAMEMAAM